MGLYSSFSQVFVTNSPALLASGKTVDALAVGQIGFLDAKTMASVTAPTYAKNKALYAVWGTPDVFTGDFSGVPNENEYSKLIKGKAIKKFRAKKAKRGQTPVYTLGWSGDVSDTDTLDIKVGESKNVFIKLTGTIIDRLYGKQGLTKLIKTTPAPIGDCTGDCDSVPCPLTAIEISAAIMADKDLKKFIRTKPILESTCYAAPTTETGYVFELTVCDTGDDKSLGLVQAQYPDEIVSRVGRVDALSTYRVVKTANSAPADFTSPTTFVPKCTTCPSGWTFTAAAKVFTVKTLASVTSGNVQSAFTGEISVALLNTDPEHKTYQVTFATTKADSAVQSEAGTAGYVATYIGTQSGICTIDTPATTSWVAGTNFVRQAKAARITLKDTVCGSSRLTELQAAYPDLVVTLVDAGGSCVHTYETTVYSNYYLTGCAVELIQFPELGLYQGAVWTPVAESVSDTTCKCGVQFETSFFNMATSECTFDAFPYENDIVHIQVSNHDPNFNSSPDDTEWVFKQVRQVEFPMGHGAYVQRLEKESKQYDQRFRSFDPVVREVQGYSLQADASKFYDQYVLEFETAEGPSGGWAAEKKSNYHLTFFVLEGQGNAIENAINGYLTSAGIDEDGAAI